MSTNVSTTFATNGKWAPRKTEMLTCPSGQEVQVRRPGPEFALRAGRVTRTFSEAIKRETEQAEAKEEGLTPDEFGQDVLDKLSDEELAAVLVFARELVCAMLVSPKLTRVPRPGFDEIGPEDVPSGDFWFLFNYAMTGFYGLKVPVAEGEVEVSDLSNFRGESGISGDSVDSAEVRADSEQPAGDQGLVGGSGD